MGQGSVFTGFSWNVEFKMKVLYLKKKNFIYLKNLLTSLETELSFFLKLEKCCRKVNIEHNLNIEKASISAWNKGVCVCVCVRVCVPKHPELKWFSVSFAWKTRTTEHSLQSIDLEQRTMRDEGTYRWFNELSKHFMLEIRILRVGKAL